MRKSLTMFRSLAWASCRFERDPGNTMLRKVQCFLLLGVLASASLHAQARDRPPSGAGGSRPVSPAVVATLLTNHSQAGDGELEVLVLWRGSPGWFLGGGRDGHSGSRTGSRGGGETLEHYFFYGDLRLKLQFNRRTRTARVQDIEVSLQDANVILVDQVDSSETPTVVGTRWIDPQVGDPPVRDEQVLGRSSELIDFLRCDASLPDGLVRPLVQEMLQMTCRALLKRQRDGLEEKIR